MVKMHTLQFPAEGRLSVVLVHGAGEHSGRYHHVVQALASRDISVVTGDLPGAGLTAEQGGLAGHVDSFDEYLEAVDGWVEQAKELNPGGRVALVGHSLGGLIVVRYLQERAAKHPQVVGAVLSSPALRTNVEIPGWKKGLAGMLDRLSPKLRLESGLDSTFVSRVPEVVAAYREDPYCGGKVSVRWYQELVRAMEQAWKKTGRVGVPVLLMQAGQDRLVDPAAAEPFFRELPKGGAFTRYPDCYHELFNEPEQGDVLNEMLDWLQGLA